MKTRRLTAAVLLAFVAFSLIVSVGLAFRGGEAEAVVPDGEVTQVYYLHGTLRCATCNGIESTVQDLVQNEHADDVAAGRMQLRSVDYQENESLAQRYNVTGNMVVVARFKDGREIETRRLDRVMELADDRDRLAQYLRDGLAGTVVEAAPKGLWVALAAAFGLGLLTAISPCPLATNIAAVSFLSRGAVQTRRVLLSGLAYTIGRTVVYVVLGVMIVLLLQASWGAGASSLSRLLLRYGGILIGPALIVVGMMLLGLLRPARSLSLAGQGLQQKAAGGGAGWAFILGILFALSFCPISAALFFGSMITLSTQSRSPVLIPTAFGVATALPVIFFALLIALASQAVGKAFQRLTQLDRILRIFAGVVFIGAGVYSSIAHLMAAL